MCGVNGFFNYSGKILSDQEAALQRMRMNVVLGHRGPDDRGALY